MEEIKHEAADSSGSQATINQIPQWNGGIDLLSIWKIKTTVSYEQDMPIKTAAALK